MNVLLVSQCDKRALAETRRILDQFAERRGDRTWQTPITMAGLDTLRRLLRRTARKNTAVACHWVRGIDHTELLWIVGDSRRFNEQGAVPTNTTRRNVLRAADENDWHSAELIRLLSGLSGLLHDLGKAIQAFQDGLRGGSVRERNRIRHEWVSLRLWEAFIGDDEDNAWLARLQSPAPDDDERWLRALRRDGMDGGGALASPFRSMARAPLAQAIGWLVVTHHRLPCLREPSKLVPSQLAVLLDELGPAWNESAFEGSDRVALAPYWTFKHGLPVENAAWRARAAHLATRLLSIRAQDRASPLDEPFVMHLSRLCLMLADHHYSSLHGESGERVKLDAPGSLIANTYAGRPNQGLVEHLVGVGQGAAEVAALLPKFATHLPHLGNHSALRKRATDERYRWQDKAADAATAMRDEAREHGAFIVNMASTGCGKTLANARIMQALADPGQGMRCAFAMGLRTLTRQTGRAFQRMLQLDDEQLAVHAGGSASGALFEYHEARAEATGSASRQALVEEDSHVSWEGNVDAHPLLRRAVADPQVRKLLLAPLLVCTIDHLTPATESLRGGRQIAPMLRLASGDLVLDEPDDFDLDDLPALTRLVHWAGLLGARVLLSSATLPSSLLRGLFDAYLSGRQQHARHCGARPGATQAPPRIACLWVDEFEAATRQCTSGEDFSQEQSRFAGRRHEHLARAAMAPRRRAKLLRLQWEPTPERVPWHRLALALAPQLLSAMRGLHEAHAVIDPVSGKRVSFGLLRMANIEPLFEMALALFAQSLPANMRLHLCCYHSRHPQLVRSSIEAQLDDLLDRRDPQAVFRKTAVRERLDDNVAQDHLFVVLGSPVTEVGRDQDHDWALVEPSSMRSLIQLAGRVRRHRPGTVDEANILVWHTNLRALRTPGQPAFRWPGFEDEAHRLETHDLEMLLRAHELEVIDARQRIVAPAPLEPARRLVDLEHQRLHEQMLPRSLPVAGRPGMASGRATAVRWALNASSWWHAGNRAALTGVLPQRQPFRARAPGQHEVTVVLLPDEDGEQLLLHQVLEGRRGTEDLYQQVEGERLVRVALEAMPVSGIQQWLVPDYLEELRALADALGLALLDCAKRFGTVSVPDRDGRRWRYHPGLGFALQQRD